MPPPKLGKLILLRHGESAWNATHQFAGWCDIDLTDVGVVQAQSCAAALSADALQRNDPALSRPDVAISSRLKRASRTLDLVLEGLNLSPETIPVHRTWRLNERHMGALTGEDKLDAARMELLMPKDKAQRYPALSPDHPLFEEMTNQAKLWLREEGDDDMAPPNGESMAEVGERVCAYFEDVICPLLRAGQTVMVAVHFGVMVALCGRLEAGTGGSFDMTVVDADGVTGIERVLKRGSFPNALPVVYEFFQELDSSGLAASSGARSIGGLVVDIERRRIVDVAGVVQRNVLRDA